jgi:hypothetical protein
MLVTIGADRNEQLTCPYVDSGCIRVQYRQLLAPSLGSLRFLRHWLLRGAGRMPEARIKDKLPIEIVVRRTNVITNLYANPGPTLFGRASKSSTNVGAGCSCHPTGAKHHRSARVPFHPVWPAPVARFSGLILDRVFNVQNIKHVHCLLPSYLH